MLRVSESFWDNISVLQYKDFETFNNFLKVI